MIAAEGLSGTRRGRRGVIEVVEGPAGERPWRVGGEKQGRGGRRGEVGVERGGGVMRVAAALPRPNATGISFAQSSFASRFLYG